jgi:hypothetical protein
MRRVLNGAMWVVLVAGILGAFYAPGDDPDANSPLRTGASSVAIHRTKCPACQPRGLRLPAEIRDDNVWVEGRAGAR